MMENMSEVTLTINGKELTGRIGQSILELALENGIDIPNLCHDPRLTPTGACRLCLVDVEGQRGPVTACSFEIQQGMVFPNHLLVSVVELEFRLALGSPCLTDNFQHLSWLHIVICFAKTC